MITMQIGLIISGILVFAGAAQWIIQTRNLTRRGYLLDCVNEAGERERERIAIEEKQRREEEERQSKRSFDLDLLITHGAAFGGFSATCPDGRPRKGVVPLEQIMMYGRQPSGKDYTYYIEDQGLLICACDETDSLIIRSGDRPFEIREAGLNRDQGVTTECARIKKDIIYYIILESHHEISIRATKCS